MCIFSRLPAHICHYIARHLYNHLIVRLSCPEPLAKRSRPAVPHYYTVSTGRTCWLRHLDFLRHYRQKRLLLRTAIACCVDVYCSRRFERTTFQRVQAMVGDMGDASRPSSVVTQTRLRHRQTPTPRNVTPACAGPRAWPHYHYTLYLPRARVAGRLHWRCLLPAGP